MAAPSRPIAARHSPPRSNFFTAEEVEFAQLSEYSSTAAGTRARALFASHRRRLLLYTERAHFYFRHRIRGIRVRVADGGIAQPLASRRAASGDDLHPPGPETVASCSLPLRRGGGGGSRSAVRPRPRTGGRPRRLSTCGLAR